jgi:hypothetical protein
MAEEELRMRDNQPSFSRREPMPLILWLIVILLFHGCSTGSSNQLQNNGQQISANRRQNYVVTHPNLPEHVKQDILEGAIQIGMTREMVVASIGDPHDVQRSGDASGIREVWVYYAPLPELDGGSLAGLSPADIAFAYSIAQSRRRATYLFFVDGVFRSFREQ